MNLEKMFEMQKELDDYIVKTKGLEGQDLLTNKILALQVELGECANEWRGFKHWSNNQNPRTLVEHLCTHCDGTGTTEDEWGVYTCEECNGNFVIGTSNPLLEEYVDCIHFFLSIAIQKKWEDHMYLSEDAIDETKESGLDGGVTGALLESMYWIMKMYMENKSDERIEKLFNMTQREFCFKNAWYTFIVTGLVGFGLTFEQIEQAYTAKWEINKQRQNNGY